MTSEEMTITMGLIGSILMRGNRYRLSRLKQRQSGHQGARWHDDKQDGNTRGEVAVTFSPNLPALKSQFGQAHLNTAVRPE